MKAFVRGFKRGFCKGITESSTEETGESTGRAVIAILNMMFGNIIFAMRSHFDYMNLTPQSEVVRDNPIGRTPPLSAQELCKRVEDLLREIDHARWEKEWDDAVAESVAIYQLMSAVHTFLDRTNLTPETRLDAYWKIRAALNQLGFTRERERKLKDEDNERVADAQFLIDNRLSPE